MSLMDLNMKNLLFMLITIYCTSAIAVKNEGSYSPVFSPDGKYLAYHNNSDDFFWDIIIENIITGEKRQVTNNQFYDTSPTWSPDGSKIAFSSDRSGQRDIYTYELSSGKVELLIEHPSMDNHPSWSPDGKYLAYLSRRDGKSQLYLYDFINRTQARLTNTEYHNFHPSWSEDSKQIIFDQYINKKSSIFSVDISDGKIKSIYDNNQSVISAKSIDENLYVSINNNGNWDLLKINLLTIDSEKLS